jgi:hypothetical protein
MQEGIEAEAVEEITPFEAREPGCLGALLHPAEERLIGPVKAPQRFPLDAALHHGVSRIIPPDLRQGLRLLRLADSDPRLLVGVDSLSQGGIIELPLLLQNRFQRPVLPGRRAQLVFVRQDLRRHDLRCGSVPELPRSANHLVEVP